MIQAISNTYTLYQARAAYVRTRRLGWLMCGAFLLSALVSLMLSFKLWGTYTHVFTFYLKWQDALTALFCFIAFLTLCGSVLVMRFLHAVRIGYVKGVFSLVDNTHIIVRDLSSKNLGSIFWMLNASFWCFVTALIGLVPVILIGWTPHLTPVPFAVVATVLATLLSLAGLVLSAAFGSFIVIGCFGIVSFWQKLGLVHTYKLDTHTIVRCDDNILTVIYPDMPESMLDLNVLEAADRQLLFTFLRERWLASERLWTLASGDDEGKIESVQEVAALPNALLVS
ncbi:MAG: hypothetical protein NVSMB38_36300 [Ktedonobacteraceae bacterium]